MYLYQRNKRNDFLANIYDRGSNWELSIFPNIQTVEILDEPEKGYRATLGFDEDTQRHVVANVLYSKDKFSIEEVLKKVESLRNCATCDTLDRDKLRLESIDIASPSIQPATSYLPTQAQEAPAPPVPLSQSVSPGIKDMFANLVLDAYLTVPGKYFLGLMLDDQSLMESAYPKGEEDMSTFMGEMIDFMSGDVEFMRSPEDAREFMSVIRGSDETKGGSSGHAAKKQMTHSNGYLVIH